jgi:hypothetical protein
MLTVGQRVRVLPPFADSFPGDHEITQVIEHDDKHFAYVLGGRWAFAPKQVEAAV